MIGFLILNKKCRIQFFKIPTQFWVIDEKPMKALQSDSVA